MKHAVPGWLTAYLVSLVSVAVAAGVHLALDSRAADHFHSVSYAAVAVSVWLGSLLRILEPAHALALGVYAVDCIAIIAAGEFLRRARAAGRRDRDFLDLAITAANMNAFDIGLEGGAVRRSANVARFYGLTTTTPDRAAWLNNLHPEDAGKHAEAVRQARETGNYSCCFRCIRPVDGRVIWVEAHGRVVRGGAGDARLTGVAFNVTERIALEDKLARHAETLRQASENKSQFIAMLAHELRNPLMPIKTGIALMKRRRAQDAPRDFTLEVLGRQTARIEALVEDLLDVSRIEQGKIQLSVRCMNLAQIVEKAVEASLPHIDAKGQRLSVILPDAAVPVRMDEARMVQVVNNLLNNSSKFTPAGGSISIRVAREGKLAKLTIADDGAGIPPGQLAAIFEPYVQSGAPAGAKPGLGLGLPLCRALVRLHGGSVDASSEGRGTGSTFTVSLPVSPEASDPACSAPREACGTS